eukprot:gene4740-4990_t
MDDAAAAEARLYALYDFVNTHRRLPEMQEHHKGVAVGQFSEYCRQQYQAQQLNQQLEHALRTIPGWHWQLQTKVLQSSFEHNIQLLRAFHQQYGRLPKARTSARLASSGNTPELEATMVLRQLQDQRKRGVLTQQQMDLVSNVLPGWKWDPRVRAPPLNAMIQILQEYVQQHGHLPKQTERLTHLNNFQLGTWCTERRGEYSRGELEVEVAQALQQQVPCWSWNLVDSAFESAVEVLRRFVALHKRMPTQREVFDGVRIGSWCNKRRLQYKQDGDLSVRRDQRINLLIQTGGNTTSEGLDGFEICEIGG